MPVPLGNPQEIATSDVELSAIVAAIRRADGARARELGEAHALPASAGSREACRPAERAAQSLQDYWWNWCPESGAINTVTGVRSRSPSDARNAGDDNHLDGL
jgi:hypothetical protein